MRAFAKSAGLALWLACAAATPAIAQQTASERADLARYQQYAGAPVDHVRLAGPKA